ncbi:unannotated protein [freshwater metagenome]|uniref:Unannotated protein n=1 Tax=freshwater metagenome TaxID=449393 RepID=A0A6J6AHL5_9ZZZZ
MADKTKASAGSATGTYTTAAAAESKRDSPCVAITIGIALCALKIATSFATSVAVPSLRPAAHTRIIGSHDKSMCFLSSVTSQEIDL